MIHVKGKRLHIHVSVGHLDRWEFFISIRPVALNTDEQVTLELVHWCVCPKEDSSGQELGCSSFTLQLFSFIFNALSLL